VSAPRSIEFKKNIIIRISDDLVKVLSDNNLDRGIVGGRDFLRFKELLKLLVFPVLNEGGDFRISE